MNRIKAAWNRTKKVLDEAGHGTRVYDLPDRPVFAGQVVVMIGAAGALGRETARNFVRYGARHLIITGDDDGKLQVLRTELRQYRVQIGNPNCRIQLEQLDLSDISQVRTFITHCRAHLDHLHVLLFNAATFVPYFESLVVGPNMTVERMMQVNCYSQCLIFMGLLALLRVSAVQQNKPAHATFVTCAGMSNSYGQTLPDDPNVLRNFLATQARFDHLYHFYLTKLLTTFFVYRHASLLSVNDGRVVVNTVWPGILRHSNLYRHLPVVSLSRARGLLHSGSCRNNDRAARVVTAAAHAGERSHGNCVVDRTRLLGQNLVMQHARSGCENLVYQLIHSVVSYEMPQLTFPLYTGADDPIVQDPWNSRM